MSAPRTAITVRNARTGTLVGERIRVANNPVARMRGLLGHPEPGSGEGMLLVPCNGIHTLLMRYAIDVAFLDRSGRVVDVRHALSPGHMIPWVRGAHQVLELPRGTLVRTETVAGDQLTLEPTETATR